MRVELERFAVIGDMGTLALVSDAGSVEWFCWPRFDSPSLFGRLLDDDGGHWTIAPTATVGARRQVYLSATNVIVTRLHTDSGVVEIEDLMAVGNGVRTLVRRARCRRGSVSMRSVMTVRPDYGRRDAVVDVGGGPSGTITIDIGDPDPLHLATSVPMTADNATITAEFDLDEGESAWFALGAAAVDADDVDRAVTTTVAYWHEWTARSTYRGRWREAVERSALTLKLLTHADTGGLIAAGTTSVPEVLGGERNWDYRFVWIRDAAFTLYALLELGYAEEASAFVGWLTKRLEASAARCADADSTNPPLSPLYDLDGNDDIDEIILDHWSGYADSSPVRVGNAASRQMQLDIYGELIDSLYIADKKSDGVSIDTWNHICTIVDWVIEHWEHPDDGMWEARSGPQRYTSSLMLCWVAVERAMRMARRRGRPADVDRWQGARDEMHRTLMERGCNDGVFTQILDGDTLDSSILLAPLVKVISPTDPMWLRTLDAIGDRLARGPLVDRYDVSVSEDGLEGQEGSFTICSFWYVEALAMAGRTDEARDLFDRLLSYATPTGLFSEEIGPDGRLLGNFPQAFTHLALISAAVRLDEGLAR
ncbi:MAG: glycoside hydrolase family 15 protein [Ilumatobacteraceae bacterium]